MEYDDPLCSPEKLSGQFPQDFESHLDVKLIRGKKSKFVSKWIAVISTKNYCALMPSI